MAKAKKKLTLRQRLRNDARAKLDGLIEQAQERVTEVVAGTSIHPALLMQLASQPKRGKTLQHNLVTALTNDAEDELEKLYNKQIALDLATGEGND